MKVKYSRLCELGLIRPDFDLSGLPETDNHYVLDIRELRGKNRHIITYATVSDDQDAAEVYAAQFDNVLHDPVPKLLAPEDEREWIERLLLIAEAAKLMRQTNEDSDPF